MLSLLHNTFEAQALVSIRTVSLNYQTLFTSTNVLLFSKRFDRVLILHSDLRLFYLYESYP